MNPGVGPAGEAFLAQLGAEFVLAEVLIVRAAKGFNLRHVLDRKQNETELRWLSLEELLTWVQTTGNGTFRPLRSAPNLPGGWRCQASSDVALLELLNEFYPGAVADWFAIRCDPPLRRAVPTHYREFTNRQSGMYRITQMLSDAQASDVVSACCDARFCLKQRLWTDGNLPADEAVSKSVIPCLEPCAILMEFARKIVRLEQETKMEIPLSATEIESMVGVLDLVEKHGPTGEREADFGSPLNRRRLQWLRQKLVALPRPAAEHRESAG